MLKEEVIRNIRNYIQGKAFQIKDPKLPITDYEDLFSYMQKTNGLFEDKELIQILVSLGISIVGAKIVSAALLDPEPTSKLSILVIGGVFLIGFGYLSILHALGQQWQVKIYSDHIELKPNEKFRRFTKQIK